ncbi:hypothetical protein VULLAG_LOCUS7386 [Vulpes lagopus]
MQRHRQREKQAPSREPDAGLEPGSAGSRPGPKAGGPPRVLRVPAGGSVSRRSSSGRGGREPRWPELRPPDSPPRPCPGVLEPPPTDPHAPWGVRSPPPPTEAGPAPRAPGRSLAPLPSRFCLKQPPRRRHLPAVAHFPELEAEADLAGALTAPRAARRCGPALEKARRGVGRAPRRRAACLGGGGCAVHPAPPPTRCLQFQIALRDPQFPWVHLPGLRGRPRCAPHPQRPMPSRYPVSLCPRRGDCAPGGAPVPRRDAGGRAEPHLGGT